MRNFPFALLLCPVLAFAQEAQDPFDSVPEDRDELAEFSEKPNTSLSIALYEVRAEDLARVMFEEGLIQQQEKLHQRVDGWVREKTAKLCDVYFLTGALGEKLRHEEIREMIYPTEFEPEDVPNTILVDKTIDLSKDLVAAFASLRTPATPTAFEPRNLGCEIGALMQPHPHAPATYQFSIRIEHVKHAGWSTFGNPEENKLSKSDIRMPVFTVDHINTQLLIKPDVPYLIATMPSRDEAGQVIEDKKILVFAKAAIAKEEKK